MPTIEDVNNNGLTDVNDIIHYTFKVTNAGNLPFASLTINDLLPGAVMSGLTLTNFAPGDVDTGNFTATYKITSTDVALGYVSNTAQAVATLADGSTTSDISDNIDPTKDNPTITAIVANPKIAVIKRITSIIDSAPANGITDAGDVINYAFDIKNTGNVDLSDVYVDDLVAAVTVVGPHIVTLTAGTTINNAFTASYTITAADITTGKFSN